MVIFENERIVVSDFQGKYLIKDKFSFQSMQIDPASFKQMCREVAEKENEKSAA